MFQRCATRGALADSSAAGLQTPDRRSCARAAGPRLGIWIVLPCQLTMMIGLAIVYSVTGGTSAKLIYDLYYTGSVRIGISLWILFFGICQIFLSLVRAPKP